MFPPEPNLPDGPQANATLQGILFAEGLHLGDSVGEAGYQGAGDDGVADVEFFEVGD